MDREMDEFVAAGGRRITPREMDVVVRQLPTMRLQWNSLDEVRYPLFREKLEFLGRLIEDFAGGIEKDLPYEAAAEAAFALSYFHKEVDVIPDFVTGGGYVDDAEVVDMVLARNAEAFARHARAKQIEVPDLPADPAP